jgi:hypothetical protein
MAVRLQIDPIQKNPWAIKIVPVNPPPPVLPELNSFCFALIQSHLETASGCRSFS